jgi:signal transduction histidine kinase/CheY-like chemotaxis protein
MSGASPLVWTLAGAALLAAGFALVLFLRLRTARGEAEASARDLRQRGQALADRSAQLHTLVRMLQVARRQGDLAELLQVLLNHTQSLLPAAEQALVLARDPVHGRLVVKASAQALRAQTLELAADELRPRFLAAAQAMPGETLGVQDEAGLGLLHALVAAPPARAMLVMPLGDPTAPSAWLLLGSSAGAQAFDAVDAEWLPALRQPFDLAIARFQAGAELAEARTALAQASRFKTVFLANISHEVRTPMNAILGFAGLGQEAAALDEAQQALRQVEEAGQVMLALVDDVLELSRLESGNLQFELSHFDLPAELDALEQRFAPRALAKGLAWRLDRRPGLARYVEGDAARIRRVLASLVGNAIKFTERGEVAVEVGTRAEADALWLEAAVRDTGPGLDTARLESYFEAFGQGEGGIARRKGGAGLGLPIARRLVQQMGGELVVDSEPGKGSRFAFRLRLAPGEAGQVAQPQRPLAQRLPGLRGLRVLLVEDNPINQEVAARMLRRVGCEVTPSPDGETAIELGARGRFDAVLMDLHMPGLDGYQTTTRLLGLPGMQGVPIIALTAHAVPGYRERCLAAGMVDYLTKPIEPEALYESLLHWAGREPPSGEAAIEPAAEAPAAIIAGAEATREALAQAGFEVDATLRRLGDDLPFYRRLLRDFLDDFARTDDEISHSLEEGQADAARRQAHAFKGVAATLGARALAETASEIERLLGADEVASAALRLPDFGLALRTACAAIEALPQDAVDAPVAAPWDEAEVEAALERLAQGLARSDPTCEDDWDALRPQLDDLDASLLDRLDGQIRAFAFGFAANSLRELRELRARSATG